MSNYDFNSLFEPIPFQNFARNMVEIRDGIFLESFAPWNDLGVDGRCVLDNGETIIFQAKRLRYSRKQLLKELKTETERLNTLSQMGVNIVRYILVVACDIEVAVKNEVMELFRPYIKSPTDIIDRNILNHLLDDKKYREVERRYSELLIPNTRVLFQSLYDVVNAPLVERSEMHFGAAVKSAKYFVETGIFEQALQKLKRSHTLIISGEPGVGKTTLANQIILYYHTRLDYRMFFYASSMNDLYIANHWDGKKVIFFDNFWGGNDFTQSQTNTNTNDLVRFIEHIQQQKNCILIMTTREYILEQGLKRHADFRRLVECDKLDLRMAQYSEADRLQIYLAHLKASPLTWKQLSSLYQLGTTVMHSPNFNPRVIGEFTKSITPDMDARKCCEDFLHYLDYPLDFWERIFQELSEEARTVYLLMAIMPLPIENDILRECYAETMQIRGKELKWKGFPDVLIELEKTIVRTDLYGPDQRKISTVTFQNPSVKDFILQEIRKKSGKI